MRIPVTFRIDTTPQDAEITAVFTSRETHPTNSEAHRACYGHVGQHSECSLAWMSERTRPATTDEYAPLLRELQSIYGVETQFDIAQGAD
jgi:hypothetical protein